MVEFATTCSMITSVIAPQGGQAKTVKCLWNSAQSMALVVTVCRMHWPSVMTYSMITIASKFYLCLLYFVCLFDGFYVQHQQSI